MANYIIFSYFVLPVSVIFFFKLTVNVTSLPPSEGNNSYKCYINGKERPTSTLPGGKLACRTPPSDQLPRIESDTGIGASDLGRGTTPRGPTSYPFIYHDEKVTPLIYLLMSNGTPFTLPSLELCIPCNCYKCTVLNTTRAFFRSRKLHLLALLGLFQTEMTDSPTLFMLELS